MEMFRRAYHHKGSSFVESYRIARFTRCVPEITTRQNRYPLILLEHVTIRSVRQSAGVMRRKACRSSTSPR